MTRKDHSWRRVDRVLAGIEESILQASDQDIIEETRAAGAAASEVRALIKRQIQLRNHAVPREAGARRQLLRNLLLARPSLASTMRVSFTGADAPSDDEVDDLIEILLERGVIKKKG